jgi:TPR repeat protein
LGLQYANGRSVDQDQATAASWFLLAANSGLARAQLVMDLNYANGSGVTRDATQVVAWLRRAADQGVGRAQYNLGVIYGRGTGVPADMVEAVQWLNLAAARGEFRAGDARKYFSRQMSQEEILQARSRSGQWVAERQRPSLPEPKRHALP